MVRRKKETGNEEREEIIKQNKNKRGDINSKGRMGKRRR